MSDERQRAATPAQLFERLDALGIEHRTTNHPPVFTVEQAKQHREGLRGSFIKNLFLRNKKKRMWLVVAPEDLRIDLKALGVAMGAGHVSFGRPERLLEFLGVEPGSVTPFALINDPQQRVEPVIDPRVLARDPLFAHPLVNTMTTSLNGDDLLRFIADCGHQPTLLELPGRG
jgi:Ala-tRNA(Pro) deacylase